MYANDTIAAQATAPGRAGVGIIRVSGPQASAIAQAVLGRVPKARVAEYLPFRAADQSVLDQGIALYFPGPNSFTGEDVLELQGHGGPVLLDMLLRRILQESNVRIARPGEFSERAFLNDKLDLTQAEAIADLIDARLAILAHSPYLLMISRAHSRRSSGRCPLGWWDTQSSRFSGRLSSRTPFL